MEDAIIVKKYFVAFLDILGYGNKIRKFTPEELKAFLEQVNGLIEATKDTLRAINSTSLNGNFDVKFKMFSDNIFLYTETSWFNLLVAASHLQVNFASSNIFIRGALSYGDLYANDDYISGSGLLRSYELEDKIAIFPRVIVAPEFTGAAKEFPNMIRATPSTSSGLHVLTSENFERNKHYFYDDDFDGWKYVSYLDFWKYLMDDKSEDDSYSIESILNHHRNNVKSNLENPAHSESVLQKYNWSKKYHNEFCQKHGFNKFKI